MGELGSIIAGVLDVGLAPTLVIILIWKGFEYLNKNNKRLYEIQIGLQIILSKLNATEEYKVTVCNCKDGQECMACCKSHLVLRTTTDCKHEPLKHEDGSIAEHVWFNTKNLPIVLQRFCTKCHLVYWEKPK